jgi:hypothetical protein
VRRRDGRELTWNRKRNTHKYEDATFNLINGNVAVT